ncbi:hypothetical protein GCM10011380_33060 [Sphingomonas metalli]|uniref:Uncharacterized protein n=1 Tax=Sphingomonas metalli TaxID=1779358 RepID=A0A916TDM4_9SPHN|nr:hypothetical protein [Sphingomonas metalli]GGB40974.1 hypothetical protein GCM10011380_33060 [Sphingomonas metalli]
MTLGTSTGRWLGDAVVAAALMTASAAWSASVPRDLVACGEIGGAAERLACFDRYLAAARTRGVETAQETSRNPARPARPATAREVVSTVGSVQPSGQGRWMLVLADRSVWQSYDAGAPAPRVGQPVHIRKGTFGSYLADIGGARGVVLKRLR